MSLNNCKKGFGKVSLLLLVVFLAGCANQQLPSFIKVPDSAKPPELQNTTQQLNPASEIVVVPAAEKQCFFQKYNGLNKLCGFNKFWRDFASFMQNWVSYYVLMTAIAMIIGWLILKRLFSA